MRSSSIAASIAVCIFSIACGHPKSPVELENGLESADPAVRRDSADGLRDGGKVPDDALPKLYAAIFKEHDADAYGAELITLGTSGDEAARPYICGNVGGQGIDDARVSRWQNRALSAWMKKNPDQGGCSMSAIEEVPRGQGPQKTNTKPVAPKANLLSPGM